MPENIPTSEFYEKSCIEGLGYTIQYYYSDNSKFEDKNLDSKVKKIRQLLNEIDVILGIYEETLPAEQDS